MDPITPYRFLSQPQRFEQLTPEEAQSVRSHPDKPIKSRIEFELESKVITDNIEHRKYAYPAHLARDENVRRNLIKTLRSKLLKEEHLYLIEDQAVTKPCGYAGYPISTRGTSVPNRLCFTEFLRNCVGVVLKVEAKQNDVIVPGGKGRISHVYGFSQDEFEAIREQIAKMKKIGDVKLVMLGGQPENYDKDEYSSEEVESNWEEVENLRKFISDLDVEVELDKAGKLREGVKSFLGVVVDESDNSVQHAIGLVTAEFV